MPRYKDTSWIGRSRLILDLTINDTATGVYLVLRSQYGFNKLMDLYSDYWDFVSPISDTEPILTFLEDECRGMLKTYYHRSPDWQAKQLRLMEKDEGTSA